MHPGTLFRTRTGELSVKVTALRLLVKSLRPLPDKWHGLADTDTRYRQRYVDLIVNDDVARRVRGAHEDRPRLRAPSSMAAASWKWKRR